METTKKSPEPLQVVSATTRTSGSEIRTAYTFGPDTELIEVFVDGEIRARIAKGERQDVYSNDATTSPHRRTGPGGNDVHSSTVIAANGCTVTTEVSVRGPRQSIAVYRDGALLCRTGNTVLEE